MDKSWNQLSDRCNLFYTAPSGLYKELLKEAEVELANRCSLYKLSMSYNFADLQQTARPQNSVMLPPSYKSMISVWVNGDEIPYREKHQWTFNKGTNGMTVQSGTPNYYDLANGFIFFDKAPSTSDVVDCWFRANMPNDPNLDKNVMLMPEINGSSDDDRVFISTTIGSEIDGHNIYAGYYDSSGQAHSLVQLKYDGSGEVDSSEPYDPSQLSFRDSNVMSNNRPMSLQTFTGGNDSGSDFTNTPLDAHEVYQKGVLGGYRLVGPVIENDYHLNLCDYAIYMATAKADPELSMKHLQIWEARLLEILNDNIDKELPIGMKEEI